MHAVYPAIGVQCVLALVSTDVHGVTGLNRVALVGHSTLPLLLHSIGDDFLPDSLHHVLEEVVRT